MEIPVYVFCGFLESGKTRFIQETLEDPQFNSGEKTLLVVCEEGMEEYDTSKFPNNQVYIETVDDVNLLTPGYFLRARKKYDAERVMIEYNGMWVMKELWDRLPEEWPISQIIMLADSNTFVNFNNNMRSLVVDKMNVSETIAFNRVSDDCDTMELHKIVRGVNRRCSILYEHTDSTIEYDDIVDPLPFSKEAKCIEIEDKDYAIWYSDLCENMEDYNGKQICFKGVVARDDEMDKNTMVVGRHVMTCCVDDIQYSALVCCYPDSDEYKNYDWVMVTAKISLEKHKIYSNKRGPVLKAVSVEPAIAPNDKIATFY